MSREQHTNLSKFHAINSFDHLFIPLFFHINFQVFIFFGLMQGHLQQEKLFALPDYPGLQND